MSDSRFWRVVAMLLVGGVFYVGHGLHGGGAELPSLESTAFAGAAWGPQGQSNFFTAREDGAVIYHWRIVNDKTTFVDAIKASQVVR